MKKKESGLIWQFRLWFYYKRLKLKRELLLKKVIAYSKSNEGSGFNNEGKYLIENGLRVFPYAFERKYNVEDLKVFYQSNYPYIYYKGKSLFFPIEYSEEKCKKYCNEILIEQDGESPHSYSSALFSIDDNDTIVDIGCAEGNFSLEYVDKVKEVFLFELDSKWKIPLELTFNPWKEKVHFSFSRLKEQKDLGFLCDPTSLQPKNVVFKIDVDGSEREILCLLDSVIPKLNSIKVAICTYHQASDASDFDNWFKSRGFKTEFSPNFMLFYHDKDLKKPFFRRGVLFAVKD